MDILTPKGQETREQERDAIALFKRSCPGFDFIETPKDQPANFDGFVVQDGVIRALVETKCRQMTFSQLHDEYGFEWLLTYEKVALGSTVANVLKVPYLGFLYLVPDRTLLVKTIWHNGETAEMRIEETRTQATVNGGTALRKNAYIEMTGAKVYKA